MHWLVAAGERAQARVSGMDMLYVGRWPLVVSSFSPSCSFWCWEKFFLGRIGTGCGTGTRRIPGRATGAVVLLLDARCSIVGTVGKQA